MRPENAHKAKRLDGLSQLAPELRARLDAMTRDYARILTRIDRMEALDADDGDDVAGRRRKTSN